MKITLFTSHQARHLALAHSLSEICEHCFVIQEVSQVIPSRRDQSIKKKSPIMQRYFEKVLSSQENIFGKTTHFNKNVSFLRIKMGDLSFLKKNFLEFALSSDLYIVFGSSYIKGWLVEYLVGKRAINIHMGVSPYYRGADCNFWALYDGNPHLVGATIHLLSKGLDNGEILYHALPLPEQCQTPFDYTMRAVKAAHISLLSSISNGILFSIIPQKQDKSKEVLYTRKMDFSEKIASEFLERNLNLQELIKRRDEKINLRYYQDPFFY